MVLLFIVVQVIVASIVVAVLNHKLKKELIEAALENLHVNISSETQGEIVVISAAEVDPQIQARIENIIKRKTNAVTIRFEIDAGIKSGLIIYIGKIVLDFSLANRLKKLTS